MIHHIVFAAILAATVACIYALYLLARHITEDAEYEPEELDVPVYESLHELDPTPFVDAVATPLPDAELCAHCKLVFAPGALQHWTLGGGPYHAGCAFHVAGAPKGAA